MFDWDDENLEHILQHAVSPDEAEDVFADTHRFSAAAHNTPTERRWGLVGLTADGRLLFVVYTRRQAAIRVVTARDASPPMRRRYRRR